MNNKTIVLTGGGTAGHVTPHLTLLPYLKQHFGRIEYIGSKSGIESKLAKENGISYHSITTCKLVRKKILKNLLIPFKLAKGTKQAKLLLKQIKPDVIFSKGGFVSVPVVRAAKKLNIPVVAHESDKSPGLANRLSAKSCNVVFTSFKDTATRVKNGEYSGAPLAAPFSISRTAAKAQLGIKTALPVLLVTGGSLGAVALNNAIKKALPELTKKYFVYHLTGKGNVIDYKHANYKQAEFSSQMPLLMRAASLCVTRGGSNTIFELANNKVPMLIVPLPKGNSRGDQEENAVYFEENGLSLTLLQKDLSIAALLQSLKLLEQKAADIAENQSEFVSTRATETIVKRIVDISARSNPARGHIHD